MGGYRVKKPGGDFQGNEYARFVAHINLVTPIELILKNILGRK